MTTPHDFGSVLGRPLDTSFGLSQFQGHGSWRVCGVALNAKHLCLFGILLKVSEIGDTFRHLLPILAKMEMSSKQKMRKGETERKPKQIKKMEGRRSKFLEGAQ